MARTKKNADVAEVQDEEMEAQPFVIYKPDPDVKSVALSDLVPLDATPIENARHAMRETSQSHIDNLVAAIEKGARLPPMKLVNTNLGQVVLGGYHRWASYLTYMKKALTDDGKKLVSAEEFADAQTKFFAPAEEVAANSPTEMLKIAFQDNLEHGMPASPNSRARFAAWLLEDAKKRGVKMRLWEAAAIAQCSRPNVSKYLIKMRNKLADKMVDFVDPEDNAEIAESEEEKAEKSEYDVAEKHMKAIIAAANYFLKQDITSSEMQTFVTGFGDSVTKEAVSELTSVVAYLYDVAKVGPTPEQKEIFGDTQSAPAVVQQEESPINQGFENVDRSEYVTEYTA